MRPTTRPEPVEPDELVEPAAETNATSAAEGQGRGDVPRPAPSRSSRRRRADKPEKTGKRGLYLTDGVWNRLQYEAIRRGVPVSTVAEDVLARYLPRFTVTREG